MYRNTEGNQKAESKNSDVCMFRGGVSKWSSTPGLGFTVMKNQFAVTAKTLKKTQKEKHPPRQMLYKSAGQRRDVTVQF